MAQAPFLTLTVGESSWWLPVAHVREVMPLPPLTSVPQAPPWIAGLVQLRGELITVIDLAVRMGHPAGASPKLQSSQVIIVGRDAKEGKFGILVDSVGGIVQSPPTGTEGAILDPADLVKD